MINIKVLTAKLIEIVQIRDIENRDESRPRGKKQKMKIHNVRAPLEAKLYVL